jgi:hypothetical protein
MRLGGADSLPAARRPPHFRRGGVTPNRGNNVASSRLWLGYSATAGRILRDGFKSQPRMRPRLRSAEAESCKIESPNSQECTGSAAIRNLRVTIGDCQKGRAARMRQHSNRPVFQEATFARRTCCKPSRLVLVASPPFFAALLIGLKGVLNPKAQVKTRRGVTL